MSVVILGAGLAGLSTDYHLPFRTKIFEKNEQPGGLCRSINIFNGFIFDYGPHLFFWKHNYVVPLVHKLMTLARKKSSAGQHSFNTYIDYPYFTNMYGLPKKIVDECIEGFVKAPKKKNPKNYEEYCYQYYGKGFAKHFMIPYAKKIWTVNPKSMTFDWVGQRIILPGIKEIKEGAYQKSNKMSNYIKYFRYPVKGGAGNLPKAMAGKNIKCNKRAVAIDTDKKTIRFADKTVEKYDTLVNTIPLGEFVKIVKNKPTNIVKYGNDLIHNSVLCSCLCLKETVDTPHQWIYYDDPKIPFNRISFQDKIGNGTVPKGKGSICVEIPYSKFKPIDKKKAISQSIKDLLRLGIIKSKSDIIGKAAIDIKYAYVIYDHKREMAVNSIIDYLESKDIYCAGRFGTWAYKWMHECILDGRETAKKIKKLSF